MRGFGLRLALVLSVLGQPALAEIDADVMRSEDVQAVRSKIARYWNLGSVEGDALQSRIIMRVSFAPDGKPTDFELIEADGPTQAGIDVLFESARRAIIRAHNDGGLPLPEAAYDSWRVLDLVFDASGTVLR
ncbi:hypothetical protein [Tabrizicola sp.]|uniref:hypothetical protein n=1 Tax=Tabrizicola sp. TaxID=2005166 RepID=UPI003F2F1111